MRLWIQRVCHSYFQKFHFCGDMFADKKVNEVCCHQLEGCAQKGHGVQMEYEVLQEFKGSCCCCM